MQEKLLDILKEKYDFIEQDGKCINVYDGCVTVIVKQKKDQIKVSSTLNMRSKVLLPTFITSGVLFGLIGVVLTTIIANAILIKQKSTKKSAISALLKS